MTVFSIDLIDDDIKFNPRIFKNSKYSSEIKDLLMKYFGKHSFLSILNYEITKNNWQYMQDNVNEKLISIIKEFNEYSVLCKYSNYQRGYVTVSKHLIKDLKEGKVNVDNLSELENSEEMLNDFFSSLYSDIKGVFYKRDIKDNKVEYKLMFRKMISGDIREIPYDLESTGTLKILEIFPFLYQAIKGKSVLIDEIDSGVHDLMIEYIIINIKNQMKGQMIITTHNTKLLESLDPEDVYIIKINVDGKKEVLCIKDFDCKKKNLRETYLKGLFYGVPIL